MLAGSLEIQLLANMARLAKDMDSARRSVGSAMASIEKSVDQAKAALGGIAAGVSFGAMAGKLVEVQRQFDVLNASLVTATGSSANAGIAFKALEEFAGTTPFGLAEVTQAFVKMRNLGLDPSEAALTSYGNTASAMGKTLNQFVEAVADAASGEFERLKEFGIKAAKQGEQVAFTFQGVTSKIGNNAGEIEKYLKAIGDNQFGGAMEERAKTLDGALSNLADTWDALFRTVSSQGTGGVIYDSVKLATGAIEDLITILKALDSSLDSGAEKGNGFKVAQESIATVFETVTALGVNVAYVLKGIGNELGGLAAQAAAVAKLDFAGAKAIGDMMKQDAAAARAQVDADTDRILNARKVAASTPKAATGDRLAQFKIKSTGKTGPSDDELKAAKKAQEAISSYIEKLKEEVALFGASEEAQAKYRLEKLKGSPAQMQQVAKLGAELDALKAADKAKKESARQAEQLEQERQQLQAQADADYQRAIEQNAANVENIRVSLLDELGQEQNAHALRLAELQKFHDARVENETLANALIEQEKKRHEQAKVDMEMRKNQEMVYMMNDSASELYNIMKKAGMEQTALGKTMFLAQKALAVAEIIMNTEVAATKALAQFGVYGAPVAMGIRAMGYASAGIVAGTAIAEVSAEGGYDVPAGVNPVAQIHAREMVLPAEHADTIRKLGKEGAGGGKITIINNTKGNIGQVTERRNENGDRVLVIEEMVAQLGDPNSKLSRAMTRNFQTQRSR